MDRSGVWMSITGINTIQTSPREISMARYRYRVVDVFTRTALEGNPLAVFPDATGIDDGTMQKIARELNLSETVFIVPVTRGDCAAHIRIFTSTMEMVFA